MSKKITELYALISMIPGDEEGLCADFGGPVAGAKRETVELRERIMRAACERARVEVPPLKIVRFVLDDSETKG